MYSSTFKDKTSPSEFGFTSYKGDKRQPSFVKTKPWSTIGKAKMEGIVGRPMIELKDRMGKRVIVKVKVRDYE